MIHPGGMSANESPSGGSELELPAAASVGGDERNEGPDVVSRRFVMKPKVDYSDFHVHVVTWNVATFLPSSRDIECLFLPQESMMIADIHNTTDIIVIGMQEAYQNVQDAVSSNVPLVGKDPLVELVSTFLAQKGFARLSFSRLLGILTMVFVKRPLLCYIRKVQTCTTKTGFLGWMGNKGASSIRFMLGDVSLCFTNCHLVPHTENVERRVEELSEIFASQTFEGPDIPSMRIMDHDILVLFGDLNFRLDGKEFSEVVEILAQNRGGELLILDQLRLEQIKGEQSVSNLYHFCEMPIDFQPSYKYEPGTDEFHDANKGRAPAWTDRILWKTHPRRLPQLTDSNPQAIMSPEYYGLHKLPRISDHKAVSAGLKLYVDISEYVPLIVFHLNDWICRTPITVSFDVLKSTGISAWDWIGLYPADYSNIEKDYVYWFYTPASRGTAQRDAVFSKKFAAEQVPSEPGVFVLVYVSSKYNAVLGMSPVFRIRSNE